jgi:hypothetical protein
MKRKIWSQCTFLRFVSFPTRGKSVGQFHGHKTSVIFLFLDTCKIVPFSSDTTLFNSYKTLMTSPLRLAFAKFVWLISHGWKYCSLIC